MCREVFLFTSLSESNQDIELIGNSALKFSAGKNLQVGGYQEVVLNRVTRIRKTVRNKIFTFDLPDITNYTFVKNNGNPNFNEYAIPTLDKDTAAYTEPLDEMNVYIIPFSHVDPGYGMTMEEYYNSRTRSTLTNMVKKLDQYKDMTFQWAEVVFLDRWWKDIPEDVKERARELVKEGRLEIVLGGWVMPDEAITHYEPVIDQLIEGHQWVLDNLKVKPKNSWSNDPFGYSGTFPYIWKKSGIENMVILRIHQAIKATLMKNHSLEFNWNQLWSDKKSNDIFCHIMPYRGYWIGDVCGPYNQHICREFAFMRENPIDKVVFLTDSNVGERARILYEQYRITAEIYRKQKKGSLFVPIFLGEDFSYVSEKDYDLIYQSYTKLFNYMNQKKEWKTNIKFGTLNEYFTDMKRYYADDADKVFPTLAGDFFPYSDYQNDYWTGYYTTRPYLKRLSRILQRKLKATDVFHSYAMATVTSPNTKLRQISKKLQSARRELGMYLHHDGITGTSLPHVMMDFNSRLERALSTTSNAIKEVLAEILTNGKAEKELIYEVDASSQARITISDTDTVIIASNPTPRKRVDVVKFLSPFKTLNIVTNGVTPVFQIKHIEDKLFEVSFVYEFPPVTVQTFQITKTSTVPENIVKEIIQGASEGDNRLYIENKFLRVLFDSKNGFISKIDMLSGKATSLQLNSQVLAYQSARSGAYIFAPRGSADNIITEKPVIKIIRGTVSSEVTVSYGWFKQTTTLYHIDGVKGQNVFITTNTDITSSNFRDKEVILRFKTDINNENIFYTDQNGFQMLGRKTYTDRPVEQNYYPMTTMFLIEDKDKRLTVHSAQPHGVSSLKNGWMEIMLDRKPSRDDNKGLGQGISDNKAYTAEFVVQLESKIKTFTDQAEYSKRLNFPSKSALLASEILNEPVFVLSSSAQEIQSEKRFTGTKSELPCDVTVAGLRNIPSQTEDKEIISMQLKKWASNVGFEEPEFCKDDSEQVTFKTLFPEKDNVELSETTLTLLDEIKPFGLDDYITPDEMELRTFKIVIKPSV